VSVVVIMILVSIEKMKMNMLVINIFNFWNHFHTNCHCHCHCLYPHTPLLPRVARLLANMRPIIKGVIKHHKGAYKLDVKS